MLLRPDLEDARFTLRIGCHALHWILNLADAFGNTACRRLRIMESRLEIVHIAGIKHKAAYALSGLPTKGADPTKLDDGIPIMVVARSNSQASNHQCNDAADGPHAKIKSTLSNDLPTLVELVEARRIDTYWHQVRQYIR